MKKNVSLLPINYLVAHPPLAPSIQLACATSTSSSFRELLDDAYKDLNHLSA